MAHPCYAPVAMLLDCVSDQQQTTAHAVQAPTSDLRASCGTSGRTAAVRSTVRCTMCAVGRAGTSMTSRCRCICSGASSAQGLRARCRCGQLALCRAVAGPRCPSMYVGISRCVAGSARGRSIVCSSQRIVSYFFECVGGHHVMIGNLQTLLARAAQYRRSRQLLAFIFAQGCYRTHAHAMHSCRILLLAPTRCE
jgi:hypothetical protein